MDDLTGVSSERLEAELVKMASRMWAATARWVHLVGEFDRRELWRSWGCRSTADWLSWQCGVATATARDQVRAARQLEHLPVISARFAAGELSYSKVRALGRVATPDTETELAHLAVATTAAQLERVLSSYRRMMSIDEVGAERALVEARAVHCQWEDDGSLDVVATLAPEDAAVFKATLDAAAKELGNHDAAVSAETDAAPRRSFTQRRADALIELVTTGTIGGQRPLTDLAVYVDASALLWGGDGVVEVEGRPVSAETARRLSCDIAFQTTITDGEGRIVGIGRRARTIPRRLRRALERRDGGCAVPGCPRTARHELHGHHIVFWSRGGPTDMTNLVLVCGHHHRMIHDGTLIVAMQDGRPVFQRGDGRAMALLPPPPPLDLDADPFDELLPRDAELRSPSALGERLDLPYALDSVIGLMG